MVSYSRFKHWFQFDTQMIPKKSTVVVTMFRDPYGEVNMFAYTILVCTHYCHYQSNTVGVSEK